MAVSKPISTTTTRNSMRAGTSSQTSLFETSPSSTPTSTPATRTVQVAKRTGKMSNGSGNSSSSSSSNARADQSQDRNTHQDQDQDTFSMVAGKTATTYTSADIQVLEGIQAIRHRPGMYIGSTTTSGLLHLIWEALDNAIDEFNAGYGKQVWVEIDREGWVTVRDEGRGMPFDPMVYQGQELPAATVILTVPHSGGKFEEGAYKTAGGLHGVGTTVINALAERLELTIWKGGRLFRQEFVAGKAQSYTIKACDPKLHGTQLRWHHDRTIFDKDVYYPHEMIESRLKASAYLNRGVTLNLCLWDETAAGATAAGGTSVTPGPEAGIQAQRGKEIVHTFFSKEGLPDYIRDMNTDANPLFRQVATIIKVKDDVSVEVAFQPNRGYKTQIMSFANAVKTRDGGVHETGFKFALTKIVNDYALKYGIIKNREKESFKPDVIQQGLAAVISVKLKDPQFQGQTKERLNNAPVEGIVRSVVNEGLSEWMEAYQPQAKEWLRKIAAMQKARNDAQLAEELGRSGQKKGGELIDTSVSKKFLKCNTNDPARSELMIVEGDSAGGTASQGRFGDFQAILKLRGKPLNVAKADLEKIVANEEIRTIINVLGTGTRATFDYSRLKFGKIIIMADADVDGLHIQCLLLTLFHQEFPDLIEHGHIYIACPPLYSVKYRGKVVWLLDDEAQASFLAEHPDAANLEFKRFKGLGEMNPKELRETTLDPATRLLKQVTIEDSVLAARLVGQLMEDTNAEARREFLAEHARKVGNELDF